MKSLDLIPRAPRRMKQPRKDQLREQLANAATTIEKQRAEIENLRAPWWKRCWNRLRLQRIATSVEVAQK